MENYPNPIKTSKQINSTFSTLNSTCLNNPTKDLENLLANNTQSEITAKLSDPELSGAFLGSVSPSLTVNNGQVTTEVAKA
jgi:hypothetical protein